MTSKIKVDNINKVSDDSNIINKCGTTITLGASGDSIALASGASQTGFGRTGTVNWDTTAKTGTFAGVSGNGYFINTTGSAFTVNLPASPSAGDIMAVKDYTGTFGTNACTVGRNGSNIRGATNDILIDKNNAGAVFVYIDGTEGWQVFFDGSDSDAQAILLCASVSGSGNTLTTSGCGSYKIATFTGPGNFTVNSLSDTAADNVVDYLVVAGGGGGTDQRGGGGGAGGFRLSNSTSMPAPLTSPLATPTGVTVTEQAYPIVIGGGGAGMGSFPSSGAFGNPGNTSSALGISSAGGGGAANDSSPGVGGNGGSGGGGVAVGGGASQPGGTGNTPPVSPPQGNNGGSGAQAPGHGAGGGGGGGAVGANGTTPGAGGNGGVGSFITSADFAGSNGTPGPVGSTKYFAGGGGGSFYCSGTPGTGGSGGGGAGGTGPGPAPGAAGAAGTANTGGGGGGGWHPSLGQAGGAGGSGIVIIRYKG